MGLILSFRSCPNFSIQSTGALFPCLQLARPRLGRNLNPECSINSTAISQTTDLVSLSDFVLFGVDEPRQLRPLSRESECRRLRS